MNHNWRPLQVYSRSISGLAGPESPMFPKWLIRALPWLNLCTGPPSFRDEDGVPQHCNKSHYQRQTTYKGLGYVLNSSRLFNRHCFDTLMKVFYDFLLSVKLPTLRRKPLFEFVLIRENMYCAKYIYVWRSLEIVRKMAPGVWNWESVLKWNLWR